MTSRRTKTTLLRVAAIAALVGGCAPAVTPPPDSARPDVVLQAYLRALVAGDCDAGAKLVARRFGKGAGELCGETRVTAYLINAEPARPSADVVEFATTLTTTGTDDRSVRAGDTTWFYELDRQPNGPWRIVGGGSGP